MLDAAARDGGRNHSPGLWSSDRGGRYRWPFGYRRMSDANFIRSLDVQASSPDNAACEAFFSQLKRTNCSSSGLEKLPPLNQFIGWWTPTSRWCNERIKICLAPSDTG
jgi:transposase InsO family protein